MRLTLQLRSYCDSPPADPRVRSFETFPIIVGRSSACDYSLNDASRYISSNHAIVTLENDQLYIQDTSANGVYVNGASEPVGRGRTVALHHNDALAIGDYTVIVSIEQLRSADSSVAGASDPFADFPSAGSGLPVQPPPFDPFKGDEPDWTPPSAQSDDPFGDDWDMNEPPVPANSPPASNAPRQDNASDWADWDTTPAASPETDVKDPFEAPEDEFDWLPGTNSETISIAPSIPGKNERPRKPATPAQRRPPGQADSRQRQTSAPEPLRAHSGSSAATVHELLSAAKLRDADFAHLSEAEVLAQTGRLLNQMVDAMMVLLQSRSEIKNAMRSDVTTLSRANNNPLKFSFSAADALTKLLSENADGYMQTDAAVQEAVDDLKLHQLAMLEGMKAAVKSMLLQFDPGKLEKTLEKSGGISANIPITREAKLWELFCEQYDAIREEAVSDFGELFGTEFRKAYEKRIRKLGRQPDF